MAQIRIDQPHRLSPEQARAAAQQVADKLAGEYGLKTAWQDDVLAFERSGVAGSLRLLPDVARFEITLSGMMSAFAPMLEEKLARKMRQVFGTPA